jgi:predicted GH43/DUF377 family glycosyl hydrolase
MSVQWRKLGRVYCAGGEQPWAASHAYCPTPVLVDGGERIRVLCAFLDSAKIGRCGWVDLDRTDPRRVVGVSGKPALDIGAPGTFDEHGVTPLSLVTLDDGRMRLYYAGWQRGLGVRYTLFVGAAESDDEGLSFTRVSRAPLLDRSDSELYVRSSAFVTRAQAGWRMWYAGGSEWVGEADNARPRYALRHATSADGISWPDAGDLCLEPRPDELGFARPCVLQRGSLLHMWYSRRGSAGGYDLGYATSHDGLAWDREDDRCGLQRGEPGAWDADMVGLSSLLVTGTDMLLFYNGNGYGATGFGVATAEGS